MRERRLLLELRSKLVGEMHVQPFTVYNDSTIEELLAARPKTLEELAGVKGFPANGKRIAGFGEAVVAIFSNKDVTDFKVDSSTGVETVLQRMEAF